MEYNSEHPIARRSPAGLDKARPIEPVDRRVPRYEPDSALPDEYGDYITEVAPVNELNLLDYRDPVVQTWKRNGFNIRPAPLHSGEMPEEAVRHLTTAVAKAGALRAHDRAAITVAENLSSGRVLIPESDLNPREKWHDIYPDVSIAETLPPQSRSETPKVLLDIPIYDSSTLPDVGLPELVRVGLHAHHDRQVVTKANNQWVDRRRDSDLVKSPGTDMIIADREGDLPNAPSVMIMGQTRGRFGASIVGVPPANTAIIGPTPDTDGFRAAVLCQLPLDSDNAEVTVNYYYPDRSPDRSESSSSRLHELTKRIAVAREDAEVLILNDPHYLGEQTLEYCRNKALDGARIYMFGEFIDPEMLESFGITRRIVSSLPSRQVGNGLVPFRNSPIQFNDLPTRPDIFILNDPVLGAMKFQVPTLRKDRDAYFVEETMHMAYRQKFDNSNTRLLQRLSEFGKGLLGRQASPERIPTRSRLLR